MIVATQAPVTQALVETLRDSYLIVGEGVEPAEPHGWQGPVGASQFLGYVVVFPISGGVRSGTLQDHEADAAMLYQVTCVSSTQADCELLLDRCTAAITREALSEELVYQRVTLVRHDFGGAQVRRDDEAEPEAPGLFYATPRWRVWVTPA